MGRALTGRAWDAVAAALDGHGYGTTGLVLDPDACADLIGLYSNAKRFRSRIVMQRHGFGRGEYQYFDYPLPPVVSAFRESLYPHLAPLANRWNEALGSDTRFPESLNAYLRQCHAAGQTRPTPLMLKYGPEDFNCLHQDLYGPFVFPL